jgi:hypothetical protein
LSGFSTCERRAIESSPPIVTLSTIVGGPSVIAKRTCAAFVLTTTTESCTSVL